MRIGTKLFAGFLTVALLVVFVGSVSAITSQRALEGVIGQNAVLHLSGMLHDMNDVIDSELRTFRLLATDTRVHDALITPASDPLFNDLAADLRRRAEFHIADAGYALYEEILITDATGKNIAQTTMMHDMQQADERWWQYAAAEGTYIGPVNYDANTDTYSLVLGIRVEKDGTVLGVIRVVLNIAKAIAVLHDAQAVSHHPSAEFFLLDAENRVLYDAMNRHTVFSDYPHEITQGYSLANDRLYAYATSTNHDHTHTTDTFAWTLGVEYAEEDILAPVIRMQRLLFFFTVFVVSLAMLIGLFIFTSISRPMQRLTDTIDGISKGNLKMIIGNELRDDTSEIGELARAFDRTLVSLKLAMRENPTNMIGERSKKE